MSVWTNQRCLTLESMVPNNTCMENPLNLVIKLWVMASSLGYCIPFHPVEQIWGY